MSSLYTLLVWAQATVSCSCRVLASTQENLVLAGFRQMSAVLESLEQQYAAEVLKRDADEDLLKRLERGIRGLKGVTEPTGQCSVGVHFQIQFGLFFCIARQ